MYILGINGGVRLGYQDISASLIKDGELIAAVEEERLNRVKHSPGQLPEMSIRWLLKHAGISMEDVSYVASHGSTWGDTYQKVLEGYLKGNFGYCPKVERIHHHDAHAASAYFASGFDQAMILSVDNSGDGASTELATGINGKMNLLERMTRPRSLGMFYSLITQYCGFVRDSDEYKLMGLASYGDRSAIDLDWLLIVGDGSFEMNLDYLKKIEPGQGQPTRQEMMFSQQLIDKLGPRRLPTEPIQQFHKDLAAAAQLKLEEALIELVTDLHRRTGLRKLCLAGGVALNCVANQRLMNLDFVDEIYVQPASSDAGISLGAAYYLAAELGESLQPMKTVYTGPASTNEQIEADLKLTGLKYRRSTNIEQETAERVSNGKVMAWFQGGTEFGPRALGNRSIIADPRRAEMKKVVNAKIKFRDAFRPFCPSVLAADKNLYFDGKSDEAPYMTITYDVKQSMHAEIPAVTHEDGTARIQTVTDQQNPRYAELLRQVKKHTGHGVLLNTSFNRNREPMVCKPIEAISCFYGSGLDSLAIGDYIIDK